jgi:galactokinase
MTERLEAMRRRFLALYGAGEIRFLSAPARINILGEHVDYVSYLPTASLTFGSDRHAMWMAYRPNTSGLVRGASTNEAYAPFSLSLREATEALCHVTDWDAFVFDRPAPAPHWRNYVNGALHYARWQHGEAIQRGVDFLIDSTIPACGGSSSSSALTCLTGAALRAVNEIAVTPHELAMASSKAEWFVGTRGGAMDHLTICLAQANRATLIQHDSQQIEFVGLPEDGSVWTTFFAHEADKGSRVMLEYNARAAASRIVIPALLADGGELPATITLAELAQRHPAAAAECARLFPQLVAARPHEALPLRAYASHHASEVRRVQQAMAGAELGVLLNESHASLRDLYEVSTPDVETLRDILLREPAVAGVRLMGGGFGGNVLALVRKEAVAALIELVQRKFYAPRGRDGLGEGAVMISLPGDGLQRLNDG